jgi:RNA polymerase sigma factor (sigma-70 family)
MSNIVSWNSTITEHYEKHGNRIKKALNFSCGDGAEDVLHDAYERALKYSSSFNGEHFEKWFNTIIRNAIRDYKNAERGKTDPSEFDEYDHVGATCSGLSDKIWRELFILIDAKSPEHAEVLHLYFSSGYSYKDIASVTKNSYFNAYRIVSRFKEELALRYGD